MSDGSLIFDTKIDSQGFNKGTRQIGDNTANLTKSFTKLGLVIGSVFATGKIIGFVKDSIKATTELENATMGLQSIVEGTGKDFNKAQEFIKSYTNDGLIPATDAITAYKNLALRGYDDSQIQSVMKALKDSSAFGRQASYSMGEAVRSATEGLKNENSILVDNAGVTKNVAKMWDEYARSIGTTANNLTQQQKIQAEVSGILKETQFQLGDAAKVADSYSGRILQLSYNFNNLKIAIGNIVRPIISTLIPVINAAIIAITKFLNLLGAKMTASTIQVNASAAKETKSSLEGATAAQKALGSATKKTAKEANKATASFDEIQKLTQNSADSAGSGGAGGGVSGGGVSDLVSEITEGQDQINELSDDVQKKLENIAKLAGIVGAAFLAWKIADGVIDSINNIRKALAEMPASKKLVLGIILTVVGLTLEIGAIKDIIENGLNGINFTEIIAGATALTIGGAMIGAAFGNAILGGAIAGFVAGIGLLFAGLYDALTSEEGINMLSSALITVGTTVIAIALAALTGGVGLAIAALVGIVIGALTAAGIWIGQHWDEIKTKFFDFIEGIKTKLSAFGSKIGNFFSGIATVIGNFFSGIATVIGRLIDGIKNIFIGISEWFTSKAVAFYDNCLKPIIDNIKNGLEWLWTNHIEPLKAKFADFVDFLKSEGERIKTKIIDPLKEAIANIVNFIGEKIKLLWDNILSPIVNFVKNVLMPTIINVIASIVNAIKYAVEAIVSKIKEIISFIKDIFIKVVTTIINKILDIIKNIINAIVSTINSFLDFLKEIVLGTITGVVNTIVNIVMSIAGTIADIIGGIITTIKGIIEFIVGVFTGDWQHAWQGIVDIFTGIFEAIIGVVKGVLNIVIDIINAMISAVEKGINAVVGALNKIHVDVPEWVPGLGGKSFGINIPTVNLKRIPKLATGTVVPANYGNFLAMLGDNKRETEVVSPLSTMKQALIEALQESGGQNVVINFEESSIGDLVRVLKPYIDKENRRRGASMQVGGAY